MTAGDRYCGANFKLVAGKVGKRRRNHADIDGIAPDSADTVHQSRSNSRPGDTAIAADHHSTVTRIQRLRSNSPADLFNDFVGQRLPDHASDVVGLEYFRVRQFHQERDCNC